jgi:DNA-directed RNA polymerase specialized sigma24 family protein
VAAGIEAWSDAELVQSAKLGNADVRVMMHRALRKLRKHLGGSA